jgi:hypothetical protein
MIKYGLMSQTPIASGLTFEGFSQQWLTEITEGNPSTVELGHRFARKLIVQWLDLDESTVEPIYCDGSGDGGIDAAYLDGGQEETRKALKAIPGFSSKASMARRFKAQPRCSRKGRR